MGSDMYSETRKQRRAHPVRRKRNTVQAGGETMGPFSQAKLQDPGTCLHFIHLATHSGLC